MYVCILRSDRSYISIYRALSPANKGNFCPTGGQSTVGEVGSSGQAPGSTGPGAAHIQGMTVASPKELINDYSEQARQSAAASGAPTDRSAFPGLYMEPTGMIFAAGRVLMYQPLDDAARPLTADVLGAVLSEIEHSTVVADDVTMGRLFTFAENLPSADQNALAKRLQLVQSLTASVKLPVLTRALAYRYWMPEGLDETSLDVWAEALNVAGSTTPVTMRSLIALCRDGIQTTALTFPKSVKGIESTERNIMESAVYSGVPSDVGVFGGLENHTAKVNGLRSVDPGLLELNRLDGQVSRLLPLGVTEASFTAKVSHPFKLKEGSAGVRLTDGEQVFSASLDSLRYGSGVLHAVFTIPQGRYKKQLRLMVENAKDGYSKLYATEQVFESFTPHAANKRWLGSKVEPIERRSVPMAVILAGAPVESRGTGAKAA